MRKLLCVFCVIFPMALHAGITVDLYGDEGSRAAEVLKKYSNSLSALEDALHQFILNDQAQNNSKKLEKVINQKIALLNKIKKDYGYAYVNLSTVNYSQDSVYTTIEVVRKNDTDRLQFVDDQKATTPSDTQDLISEMARYDDMGLKFFLTDQLKLKKYNCPVYHCTWGFDHPELKPFFEQFQQGVKKHKQLIKNTLQSDANPERRAAAAFLVGHFDNPQEIIDLLLPHVLDNDSGLRNNAMRVIGMTLMKYKTAEINIDPFLRLLESPYDTDRNKSLLVLLQLCDTHQQKIMKEGKKSLLALLALKQPNNHGEAYQILKKISGKNYRDTDIQSWTAWFDSVSPS